MTVISQRTFRPLPGKTAVLRERVHRLAEIMTRCGARTRIAHVAWGDGARDIHLYGVFDTVEAGAAMAAKMAADPVATALQAEVEKEPASVWEGPHVWRVAYGATKPDFPVILQREYEVDRRHLRSALALMPDVQALMPDVPMLAIVPVIAGDMGRLMIGYYAQSLVEMGKRIDQIGASEAFQSILVRAAEHGRLITSRVIVNA